MEKIRKNIFVRERRSNDIIDKNYIVGLIDGRVTRQGWHGGSFNITISKDKKRSSNYRVVCELHITQSANSIKVLEAIKDYFGCGVVKTDNKLTNTSLVISS